MGQSAQTKLCQKFVRNPVIIRLKLTLYLYLLREVIKSANCEVGKGLKFHNWATIDWTGRIFVQDIQDF